MAEPVLIEDAVVAAAGEPAAGQAVVLADGTVAWTGPRSALPERWAGARSWSAEGRLVTAGLVDCHTHVLFGGDRRGEFAERASGRATYVEQLAGPDSGVRATAAATAEETDDELIAAASRRAGWLIRSGVTTLEVKTGYGVDPEAELRLLRLAHRLRAELPIRVRITLLAGHVYPADVDRDDYEQTTDWVSRICDELVPAAREVGVDAVEVYLDEEGGLTLDDASTILEVAYKTKTATRLQTDHLSDSAGAALAPAFNAKAAAHLNFPDEVAVKAMAAGGTTAVLLPGSLLELGMAERPPVDLLRSAGIPIAVATGLNPGSSPIASLPLAAHLAVVTLGLTPAEAFAAVTVNAARALGLTDGTGTLAAGAPADVVVWDATHPDEIVYWAAAPLVRASWSSGELVEVP
ncbi:imidazolonepropionase [Pseudonocardia dioxanivorans]|uniref:imidazolonepropionase n=1 Tax=Pseudonocardia dioxanivorans TaxID=240495 RepID=UPI000CD09F9D|nr:imidazolonepropionase [Pseudonocardia dioxanivorans]